MKNNAYKIAVVVTLLVFAVVGAFVYMNSGSQTAGSQSSDQPSIEGQPTMGNTDSPVQVVEFGDFKCPSCKAWGEMIYPQLVSDYVDTDKISFSYVNVLFHGQESELASLAAESIYKMDPDSYWDFQKKLYEEQPAQNHDAVWVTNEKLLEVAAETTDVDLAQLEEELNNATMADEVAIDTELVEQFDVAFTPSIIVNGTMLEDPFDYEAIKALIDEGLEENE
ncbi:thioredoxin domain-containing protein [Jeotgalibacillus aurantiacus]|uniref:thioredoxin domain-containing protein n=1 Tax=Jeotgalibacillus aurantiacus TaxID=2763266 RepID=UPI001D0A3981|nr:thioredoxin domain-containing protein [Jeotgalibacillus aurantiacus]